VADRAVGHVRGAGGHDVREGGVDGAVRVGCVCCGQLGAAGVGDWSAGLGDWRWNFGLAHGADGGGNWDRHGCDGSVGAVRHCGCAAVDSGDVGGVDG